jgi:hypothetical protein
MGCGSAVGALDRGWEAVEAVEAADDGGQELWRSSGEGSRAEEERRSNAAWWNG